MNYPTFVNNGVWKAILNTSLEIRLGLERIWGSFVTLLPGFCCSGNLYSTKSLAIENWSDAVDGFAAIATAAYSSASHYEI